MPPKRRWTLSWVETMHKKRRKSLCQRLSRLSLSRRRSLLCSKTVTKMKKTALSQARSPQHQLKQPSRSQRKTCSAAVLRMNQRKIPSSLGQSPLLRPQLPKLRSQHPRKSRTCLQAAASQMNQMTASSRQRNLLLSRRVLSKTVRNRNRHQR